MAKKKKLVINNQELTPTVLATVRDKKKTNLFGVIWIFFIFAVFIGAVYYLPDISQYVNQYLNPEKDITLVEEPDLTPSKDDEDDDTSIELKTYDYSEGLIITITNNDTSFTLSNFSIENNTIDFTITNISQNILDFNQYNYFLSLYNATPTLLERIWLTDIVVGVNETINLSYEVSSTDISKISLPEIDQTEYPSHVVDASDSGNASLTCTKGYETVTYDLKNNQVFAITDIYEVPSTEGAYSTLFGNYTLLAQTLNAIDGVSSSVTEKDGQLTFRTLINLYSAAKDDIDLKIMYDKDTDAKIIYFELSASGYTCN